MSKYTTIAQIKADIKLSYAKILDFYSEIQADTHGMAYLIVEMKDNTTLAEIEALYFTPAVITDMEGKNIYSGICVSVAIENQDGYQKLILELSDLEVAADMSRKSCQTFWMRYCRNMDATCSWNRIRQYQQLYISRMKRTGSLPAE